MNMGAEELLLYAAERKKRAAEYSKKGYAKNSQKMKENYDRDRAQDIDALCLKKRIQAIAWVAKNKEKANAASKKSKNHAVVNFGSIVHAARRHSITAASSRDTTALPDTRKMFSDTIRLPDNALTE
jgi:hypothetical protein